MFTGIIQHTGTIKKKEVLVHAYRLSVDAGPIATLVQLGSSVAISGVCLTVTEIQGKILVFDVMQETITKTAFSALTEGMSVNIEPSLKVGDEVGGHFVYGHVDCVARVVNTKTQGDTLLVSCALPGEWQRYIVPQGAITLHGVSLTIATVTKEGFVVSLVPFTQHHTTFESVSVGDLLNVEIDMIAKYITQATR